MDVPFIEKVKAKIWEILNVFDKELLIYYFSIVTCMLIVEAILVGWKDSSIRRIFVFKGSVRTDFVFFLIDAFNIYNLIAVGVTFGVFHLLARLFYEATNFDLIHQLPGLPLQFAVLFVLNDLKNYFSHWLFHRYDALWKLHEFHHSATEFCMLTRYRGHFLEHAIKRLFDVLPFAILGSIEAYFAVKVLSEIHQLAVHSAYRSNWGFIGKYILVSPAAHRIHHSAARKHYNRNMGSTFIFWDHLFGTYHEVEDVEELGVEDNPYNEQGVIKDVIAGFTRFNSSLRTTIKKPKAE